MRITLFVVILLSCPNVSIAYDFGYPTGRAWTDINNDGRPDYCRVIGDQHNQRVACTLAIQDGQNEQNPPNGTSIISNQLDWGSNLGRAWIDINADKVADFCRVVGSEPFKAKIRCLTMQGNGLGFSSEIESPMIDWGYDDTRVWLDVNLDGIQDFCRAVGDVSRPVVRCLLTYPENIKNGSPFSGETDFPRDKDAVEKIIRGLRAATLERYKIEKTTPSAQVSPARIVQYVNIIIRIMMLERDSKKPDMGKSEGRGFIEHNNNTGTEIFRGDVPAERLKWAGRQS